jgi:hypothetical protein
MPFEMKQHRKAFLSVNYTVCPRCHKDTIVVNRNGNVYRLDAEGKDFHLKECRARSNMTAKRQTYLNRFGTPIKSSY